MNLSLSLSLPTFRRSVYGCSSFLLAGWILAAGGTAFAQGTRLWTQSRFDEFEKGVPQGIQITSDGKLVSGPVASEVLTTPSSFVWSIAPGKNGVTYLATGSPATVLRVTADGKSTKVFETKALSVQVLRMGPDGALYAATLPDGKVYRLKADATAAVDEGSAEVVFDRNQLDSDRKPDGKSRYIWDMTFDPGGRLYVATGGPGAVYRVDAKQAHSQAELFFKTDEQHVRSLAWDRKGNLIAGTDGSGLVYRIDPNGKGYVLFSAPRREVTAVAVGADGTIFAADVGDKNRNPLPQLPVQSGGMGITISFSQPGSVQAANASTSLPEGSEIYAIRPNEAPRKIWAGKDEIVYQLAVGLAGRGADGVTALTGNRGRIFAIHPDGSYSDIAHLEAQQAVAMVETAGGWLVGTANTGKLFKLSLAGRNAEDHSYASDVLDAGALARWGRVEAEPGSHSYQIWTRSGNVEQPVRSAKDWGWSDWQPTADDQVASPPGRYLQWKVMLSDRGVVGGIGVNYLPVNSAPVVDDVLVAPGARVVAQPPAGQTATVTLAFASALQGAGTGTASDANAGPLPALKDKTAVTVRWTAHDDNGDDLSYDLFLRGDGEKVWRLLKKGLTDKVYSFDGASLPDSGYQVRVVATDAPSHTPGDALSSELVSERFELDTTAPVISGLKAGAAAPEDCNQSPCAKASSLPVSFDAKDAASPIAHAEYSVDAGPWQYVEPVGGLSDAREEHYSVRVALPASSDGKEQPEHLITVRVYDRHENMAVAKVVVAAEK